MPSWPTHIFLTFATMSAIEYYIFGLSHIKDVFSLFLFFMVVLVGGLMPDLIEPYKKGKKHRGFFHSMIMIPVLLIALVFINEYYHPWFMIFIFYFAISYIFHIVIDGFD